MLLPPETAAFGQPGSSSSWLTQNGRTPSTDHDSLSMAEHGSDPEKERIILRRQMYQEFVILRI